MSQSHDYSLVMPAYTSGQPSSVSDAVTVADMSSAVIGLSVTVAIVIVIFVIIVIISLVVIIVLCHRQGTHCDNDHDPLYNIISFIQVHHAPRHTRASLPHAALTYICISIYNVKNSRIKKESTS